MKADEASFDRGILSVSSDAQFSAIFLPVNCFVESTCLNALRMSSSAEKNRKKYLICVWDFSLLWVEVLAKKKYVSTVLLRLFSAGIRRKGEGKKSPERGTKRTLDLDFTQVCWRRTLQSSYFAVLFQAYVRISLAG